MKEGKRKELSVLRVLCRENISMIKLLSPCAEQEKENKVEILKFLHYEHVWVTTWS